MTYTLIIAGYIFAAGLNADMCNALQAQAVYELPTITASAIVCTPEKGV